MRWFGALGIWTLEHISVDNWASVRRNVEVTRDTGEVRRLGENV